MPIYDDLLNQSWYEQFVGKKEDGHETGMTPKFHAYFRRWVRNDHEAEDLTQTLWLKHFEQFRDLINQESISEEDETEQVKWLWMVAERLRIDTHRKREVRERHDAEEREARKRHDTEEQETILTAPEGESPSTGNPERDLELRTREICVEKGLSSMKQEHSKAIELQIAGYSFKEIAEIIGLNQKSLGTTLHRARHRFQELFCRECPDECPEYQGAAT